MSELTIEGTFRHGKMYRGNGRWAKVLVTRLSTKTLVSIAYGRKGELKAFACFDKNDVKGLTQTSADREARFYIECGATL